MLILELKRLMSMENTYMGTRQSISLLFMACTFTNPNKTVLTRIQDEHWKGIRAEYKSATTYNTRHIHLKHLATDQNTSMWVLDSPLLSRFNHTGLVLGVIAINTEERPMKKSFPTNKVWLTPD